MVKSRRGPVAVRGGEMVMLPSRHWRLELSTCEKAFFWEAYISIEDPLTRPDPVHP